MTVGRRLRVVALIVTIVAAAVGGVGAASAVAAASAPGPALTERTACAGPSTTASAIGACTSSIVAPADVVRSTAPFRRLSAGAWTATPRPAVHDLLAIVETGEVRTCPRPPATHNHSRAPPTP